MHIIKWTAVLSAFWLLLSGYIQPLLLSFGVISVLLVIVLLKRMDAVDKEPKLVTSGSQLVRYVLWLLGEIWSSSTQVTKLIWGSPDKLSPTLAKIPADTVPESNQVLYANSITLTPGTLSIDLEDNELTVHALQESSIPELQEGGMATKISDTWSNDK